jgi:hypothetical protein
MTVTARQRPQEQYQKSTAYSYWAPLANRREPWPLNVTVNIDFVESIAARARVGSRCLEELHCDVLIQEQ